MTTFDLKIQHDENAPEMSRWQVVVSSEGQYNAFARASLKLTMMELEKRLSKRTKYVRQFPLSTVLAPDGVRQRISAQVGYGG